MGNWLEALGATLLTGSEMAGRAQLERRQRELDEQEANERNARVALLGAQREDVVRDRERTQALDALSAGPNVELSPEAAEAVRRGGFGSRIREERSLDSTAFRAGADGAVEREFSPGQGTGRLRINPTAAEESQFDADARGRQLHQLQVGELQANATERSRQAGFRAAVNNSDVFFAQRPEKRQALWTQAGYPGEAPRTEEERRELLSFQHGQRMQEIGAMYPPERFDNAGGDPKTKLWWTNANAIADNVRAEFYPLLQAAANSDDLERIAQLQQQMRARQTQEMQKLGPMPGAVPEQTNSIDNLLSTLPPAQGVVIRQNLHNPRFLAELRAEDPGMYQKLVEAGAILRPIASHARNR